MLCVNSLINNYLEVTNTVIKRLCVISLILIFPLLQSCASVISATTAEPIADKPDQRTMGARIDDEVIEVKAKVNIEKVDPELAQAHIIVTSFNGVVLLAGQVPSESLRQSAATTVSKINNVRRVHNELTVSGSTSWVARSNDTWITTKVKTKLLANSENRRRPH